MIITGKLYGGKVAHIHKGEGKTLCGRYVLIISAPDGVRLCKSCAKITGTESVSMPNEVHPDDVEALSVIETLAQNVSNDRQRAAVESLPSVVRRTSLEWYKSMRVLLVKNAKHKPSDVLADMNGARDWAFATLLINAEKRGEILPLPERKPKPIEFLMNTAPTESDQVCNGDNPIMPTIKRGGGDGMVNPNSKSVAKPVRTGGFAGSDKQKDLILSLVRQIDELNSEMYSTVKPLAEGYTEEYINSFNTSAKVRTDIDGLFQLLDILKSKAKEKRAEARKVENKANPAEDGYYILGETFVCVKWNRAGTGQYATTWDGDSWHYDGRASYSIIRDVKAGKLAMMTPDDAKRFGDLYGQCFKCSRTLTDPESIASGYGPICGGRMGW